MTRRGFLLATSSGAAVATLSACGKRVARHAAPVSADVAILSRALDFEHMAVAAYTAAIPLLAGTTQKAAKAFLVQELSHVSALTGLVRAAGGKPEPPAANYRLGRPRSQAEVLRLLRGIENETIANYVDAIPKLSAAAARARLASILANEAQHIALVNQALRRPAAPEALVTGRV